MQKRLSSVRFLSPFISLLTLLTASLTWRHPWLTLCLLLLLSVFAIISAEDPKRAFRFWLIVSISGPLAEIVAIHFGAWHYAQPTQHLPIPLWLAPTWGLAGMFFLRLWASIKPSEPTS